MLKNNNAASFFGTQFRAWALGVRYANKKILFTLLFFFTVTTLAIWGALLKQEVILNMTLLFRGNALAIR